MKKYPTEEDYKNGRVRWEGTTIHIVPPKSRATSTNPKDLLGVKKVSLSKIPGTSLLHLAHALMDGARKYGAFNWRDKAVVAHIYVDAAKRHLDAWFDGEQEAEDSGVHHLGHAAACIAILLDAEETGNLVDDRPVKPGQPSAFARVLKRLNAKIATRPPEAA